MLSQSWLYLALHDIFSLIQIKSPKVYCLVRYSRKHSVFSQFQKETKVFRKPLEQTSTVLFQLYRPWHWTHLWENAFQLQFRNWDFSQFQNSENSRQSISDLIDFPQILEIGIKAKNKVAVYHSMIIGGWNRIVIGESRSLQNA